MPYWNSPLPPCGSSVPADENSDSLHRSAPLSSLSLAVLLRSLDEAQAVVLGVVEFAPVNAIKRQLTGSTSRFQLPSVTDERSDVNHQRRPQKHAETGFGCMFEGGS